MTTESKKLRAATGVGTLLGAAAWAFAAGVAASLVGLAVDGLPAFAAGLAGVVATVLVLAVGALFVDTVAGFMPAASLLLALLTYVCQLLVLTVALAAVAGTASETVTRWAAVALIAVTLAWTLAHVVLATRRRITAYDVVLPSEIPSASDAVSGARGPGAR